MGEVQTCPKCGALITKELARCRRCNTYLHGTALEGALIESLLPASLRAAPGTASVALLTLLYYVMMVVLAAPVDHGALIGFSSFSLVQLGATSGARQLLGEHWRYVTSIFAHHDLLHLAFNLWALGSAGPLMEELFDRKKMMLIYLVSGVVSMIVSAVWYVEVLGQYGFVSAGASGAVCGLIGAALFGARRLGSEGKEVAAGMLRWSLYMIAWGFLMAGINNAAHLGGWVVGALCGRVVPLGLARSTAANRALSVATLGALALVVGCTATMLAELRGSQASLAADDQPRRILGFAYGDPAPWSSADRPHIFERCAAHLGAELAPPPEAIEDCELNARANDAATSFAMLAHLYMRLGRLEEADRYARLAQRMGARVLTEDAPEASP